MPSSWLYPVQAMAYLDLAHFAPLQGRSSTPAPHTVEPPQIGERRIRLQGAPNRKDLIDVLPAFTQGSIVSIKNPDPAD